MFNMDIEDHVVHLSRVLAMLGENKLYMKREKCDFTSAKIMFLGHLVSVGQVRMDTKKVQVILEWETPTMVFDLPSFLGLANHYH